MARPSKLTPAQWAEIERRIAEGESMNSLAKKFKIAESSLREKVSSNPRKIKEIAEQIVKTEQALSALPISARVSAIDLSQKMMAIQANLATAAELNAATAIKMAQAANIKMQAVDETSPEGHVEAISMAISLVKGSNDAARMPMDLLTANKQSSPAPEQIRIVGGLPG
jgi:hypothetical protein